MNDAERTDARRKLNETLLDAARWQADISEADATIRRLDGSRDANGADLTFWYSRSAELLRLKAEALDRAGAIAAALYVPNEPTRV